MELTLKEAAASRAPRGGAQTAPAREVQRRRAGAAVVHGVTTDDLGLAPLFTLAGFEGSLGEYIELLYGQYHAMVYEAGIRLWGMPLVGRDRQEADGRDSTFWHLITSHTSETDQTRLLNLKRCALLPRVWDVLERLANESICIYWWQERKAHVLAAPANFSMVVVLRRIRGTYELVTAWPTDSPRRRRLTFQRAASRWAVSEYKGPPGTTAPWPGAQR